MYDSKRNRRDAAAHAIGAVKTPREEYSNLNVELCGSVGSLMRFFCAITIYAPFRARTRCSFWPAQTLLLIVILVLYHTSLGTLSVSRFNLYSSLGTYFISRAIYSFILHGSCRACDGVAGIMQKLDRITGVDHWTSEVPGTGFYTWKHLFEITPS